MELLSRPSHEIEIVIDSHGNCLDPRRMFKKQEVNIQVLGAGKKNFKYVELYIDAVCTIFKFPSTHSWVII